MPNNKDFRQDRGVVAFFGTMKPELRIPRCQGTDFGKSKCLFGKSKCHYAPEQPELVASTFTSHTGNAITIIIQTHVAFPTDKTPAVPVKPIQRPGLRIRWTEKAPSEDRKTAHYILQFPAFSQTPKLQAAKANKRVRHGHMQPFTKDNAGSAARYIYP